MATPAAVYKPRNPHATDYYRCVEDHLETFIQVYEERFERTYGFFHPYRPLAHQIKTRGKGPCAACP